jgi:[acyl-carrier-protein] S-malonyltransferase
MFKKVAFLFPGQGAQDVGMLSDNGQSDFFLANYPLLCDTIGLDPLKEIEKGNIATISKNQISSLLTVFISAVSLDIYLRKNPFPQYFSGYSIGQWTAIYASGMIDFENLLRIVKLRSQYMDEALEGIQSGMLAVIGLGEDVLNEKCLEISDKVGFIAISNYNCLGQYTLAGTEKACQQIVIELEKLHPKKMIRIPVSGAWHCPLLNTAADKFGKVLQTINLIEGKAPIINNVTGDFFSSDIKEMKIDLAVHISHPVMWEKGIKTLLRYNCSEFIEIGYGNILSKFGFFIDRRSNFKSFYSL